MEIATARRPLSDLQFERRVIPLQTQAPEQPAQLSLFYATSLEIFQVARWCRASPENTFSDLPVVNDPRDLTLKDDGMALCLYDDTIKAWSTAPDWAPRWSEVGERIANVIKKNPNIQSSWDGSVNHLSLGPETLQNFREDPWVDENGSVRPIPSPFMLANSLEEEVKRLEAAYINLPCDEDEESHIPHSPASDAATTPPLSPCTPFLSPDSIGSPYGLPGSPELENPFSFALSLSLSGHQTISPYEIFSPLPQVEELGGAVGESEAPPTPVVSTRPLPLFEPCSDPTPNTPLFRSPSPPVAGPSTSRSVLKRPKRSEDEDGSDESDEFTPKKRKVTRLGKRTKVGPIGRIGVKLKGKGAKCDLCGKHFGRATDLPRHKASCKANPERAIRSDRCEVCNKLLPVRADAIKRHLESKTCLSKRRRGCDEDPYLSE